MIPALQWKGKGSTKAAKIAHEAVEEGRAGRDAPAARRRGGGARGADPARGGSSRAGPGHRVQGRRPARHARLRGHKRRPRRPGRRSRERLSELQERLYAEAKGGGTARRCCSSSRAWTPRARAASCGTSSARWTRRACSTRRSRRRPPRSAARLPLADPQGAARPGGSGVFDRSHYEDVLIVRVHELVPRASGRAALRRRSTTSSAAVVESRHDDRQGACCTSRADEQKARLHRAAGPPGQVLEVQPRRRRRADALGRLPGGLPDRAQRCSTDAAPWFVVPADRKWYARLGRAAAPARAPGGDRPAVAGRRLRRRSREGPARRHLTDRLGARRRTQERHGQVGEDVGERTCRPSARGR